MISILALHEFSVRTRINHLNLPGPHFLPVKWKWELYLSFLLHRLLKSKGNKRCVNVPAKNTKLLYKYKVKSQWSFTKQKDGTAFIMFVHFCRRENHVPHKFKSCKCVMETFSKVNKAHTLELPYSFTH